jgi:diaminohydroxyphosphoribosylaminopyrimidine deaminase/5-amino-6-(5-phosphoribosylamino)uracil reductase
MTTRAQHQADASAADAFRPDERAGMQRAIELSRLGPANDPNPQVGCVILAPDGTTLAEGWHRGRGTAHAEVDALSKLQDARLAVGATAVVTLEPCNHVGATGPCSEALIEAGVARVVYAVADPGVVSSGGAERLREAGVDVAAGLDTEAVTESILPWLTAVKRGTPFVTVKWASSLDGRAAADDGTSRWITGEPARLDLHERRSLAGAIAVGTGTLLSDDPSLTARKADGTLYAGQPVPVVIGFRGVPSGAAVQQHPAPRLDFATHDLHAVVRDLGERGIRHLFVEGGPTLASAFIAQGLADELLVYLAPTVLLGGSRVALTELGVDSIDAKRRLRLVSVDRLGDDLRIVARPEPAPSLERI